MRFLDMKNILRKSNSLADLSTRLTGRCEPYKMGFSSLHSCLLRSLSFCHDPIPPFLSYVRVYSEIPYHR